MRLRFLALGCVVAIAAACGSSEKTGSTGAGGTGSDGGASTDGVPGAGDDGGGASSGSGGPPPPPGPGMKTTHETMLVSGQTRSYILSVPETYDAARAYPLVMVFHGNPGTADSMLQAFPFDSASKQDAVVAYPDGANNNWDLYTPTAQNPDIPFIQALAGEIAKKVHVDTGHVFGSGFSGGAFFMNQINCRLPGVFKAFASHAGGAPAESGSPPSWPNGCVKCAGGPIPALILHGDADNVVAPSGSTYAASCWSTTNGCTSTDPSTFAATTPSPCVRNTTCGASSPVELCIVPGIGHTQWSQGTSVAWSFFKSIP